ncbi:MAG: acyltransferase [Acidimicrobiia bacterium]|nr:acyltransferase [Acidimicrobiia bacterium]
MDATSRPWRLGYVPALDGLRGIAVALVLMNHTGLPFTGTAGTVGVNVFFVLSGFLITRLLIEEKEKHGSISLRQFYMRRVLRIFPAMYVYLAVTAVVGYIFREPLNQILYAGLYVSNLVRAGGNSMPLMPHTWSLAMEEQFYLIWPVLIVVVFGAASLAGAKSIAARIAIGGIAVSLVARFALGMSGASLLRLHNGPDLAAAVLLLGCLLAVWISDRAAPLAHPAAWVAGMAVILASSLGEKSTSFYMTWLLIAVVGSGLVIGHLALSRSPTWINRVMTLSPLLYLGKISYGLYLWHYTVYFVVKKNVTVYPYKPLLQISLSLIVAALSYRYIERPFLRWKDRLRQPDPERTASPALV